MSDAQRQQLIERLVQQIRQILDDDFLEPAARTAEARRFFAARRDKLSAAEQRQVLAAVDLAEPPEPPAGTTGSVAVSGGDLRGVTAGLIAGNVSVQQFFDQKPGDDHLELLAAYLQTV